MATRSKRQLSFYAEPDVDLYLALLSAESKTAVINSTIRQRIWTDARVNLNDGKRPQPYAALSEIEQLEVHSNLILQELSLDSVDEEIWKTVQGTGSGTAKDITGRYLALHEYKHKEAFIITRIRSQGERDAYRKAHPPRMRYYCDDHTTKNAEMMSGVNLTNILCSICGRTAWYSEYN